jgi:hypothetical protein
LLDNRAPPTQGPYSGASGAIGCSCEKRRAKFKIALIVKNMAIKKVFLIAFEYYTCGIQNIDDIILMARFDEFWSFVLSLLPAARIIFL